MSAQFAPQFDDLLPTQQLTLLVLYEARDEPPLMNDEVARRYEAAIAESGSIEAAILSKLIKARQRKQLC